eukprot:TRINITY_DN3744_c0_g1_i3.p2 TRINITY_DN3744_c0_g1~~TRINITY_DN3744_c0_g1_i3.p2  ORF type:complete len:234 (+),score=36.15 TRINITY_DN3744_c0_g1_i3:57-758(+)
MSCCVYVAERVERCGRVRGPTELLGCRVGRRAWVATAVGACYTRQSDGVVGVLLPPDAPAAAGVSVCLRQSTEAAPGVWPATADTRLVILSEALCRTGIAGADSRTADATLYKAVRAVAQRPTAPPPPPPRPDNQARRALAVPSSLAAAAGTSCLCCIVGCRLNALRRALLPAGAAGGGRAAAVRSPLRGGGLPLCSARVRGRALRCAAARRRRRRGLQRLGGGRARRPVRFH